MSNKRDRTKGYNGLKRKKFDEGQEERSNKKMISTKKFKNDREKPVSIKKEKRKAYGGTLFIDRLNEDEGSEGKIKSSSSSSSSEGEGEDLSNSDYEEDRSSLKSYSSSNDPTYSSSSSSSSSISKNRLPKLRVGYASIGDLKGFYEDDDGDDRVGRKVDRKKDKMSSIKKEESDLIKFENEKFRKNRRGQRARRLIWERKYGKDAKHLKTLRKDRQGDRNFKDDQQQGRMTKSYKKNDQRKIEGSNFQSSRFSKNSSSSSSSTFNNKLVGKDNSNLEPLGKRQVKNHKTDDGNLSRIDKNFLKSNINSNSNKKVDNDEIHPSWKAKKNICLDINSLKPTGKKIKF